VKNIGIYSTEEVTSLGANKANTYIRLKLNGKLYEADLKEEVQIDEDDINTEVLQQPGKSAWWNTLHTLIQDKAGKLKRQLERKKAEIAINIRTKQYERLTSTLKITEKAIDELITSDEEYIELEEKYYKVIKQVNLLKDARIAFDQRVGMLQTYSSNKRDEQKHLGLMKDQYKLKKKKKKNKKEDDE